MTEIRSFQRHPLNPHAMRPTSFCVLAALLLGACGAEEGPPSDTGTVDHPRTLLGVLDTTLASQATALAPGLRASSGIGILPYGANVNRDGVAYVTLHGDIDAIVRWGFRTREFSDGVTLTGDEPTNVSFSPDGATAYVASQMSHSVDVVDVATDQVITTAATPGNDPYQTVASPDGTRFFASGSADMIWAFDATTHAVVDTIPVDAGPNGMAITKDGKWMFVSHLSSGVVGRITLATGVYDTLAIIGGTPVHGLDVSPDGAKLYIVSQGTDSLYAFDTETGANLGQVYAGSQPFGLAATPDGGEMRICPPSRPCIWAATSAVSPSIRRGGGPSSPMKMATW